MSDVAGMEDLCDLRAAARASASIEAGKVIDSFCYRLEALLRNRQELAEALANFENDDGSVPVTIWRQAQDALAKAKELDND